MAITPSQWSHVLTIPESYTPSAATSGQTLVITESVIAKLSAADQTTFWSNVANGGGDVRICESSDGTNQLPAEIVSLDNAAQTCVIWTRKPTYNGTGDLYLFIGKAGETQPAVTDPFGRNAVWVDYARRVHFDNDLTTDSTGAEAFTNSLTLSTAGVIDEGADFNNGSAFLKSQNTTLPDLSAGLVSLCLWVDFKNLGGFRNRILQLNDNAGGAFVVANGGTDGIFIKKGQRNTKITTGVLVTAPSNGYFKLDIVFDDSQSLELDKYKIYIDNVLQSNVEDTAPFATPGAANDIALGARVSGASSTQSSIDEFGYYSKEKSPDYIATEYNNQSDPAAFYGTPTIAETGGVTGVTADAAYTINAPTFTSSASATLPQPIADAAYTINAPTFSVNATVIKTGAEASLSFAVSKPLFSVDASSTLPDAVAECNITISIPIFSAYRSVPESRLQARKTVSVISNRGRVISATSKATRIVRVN